MQRLKSMRIFSYRKLENINSFCERTEGRPKHPGPLDQRHNHVLESLCKPFEKSANDRQKNSFYSKAFLPPNKVDTTESIQICQKLRVSFL
jgi:hypothetical protein